MDFVIRYCWYIVKIRNCPTKSKFLLKLRTIAKNNALHRLCHQIFTTYEAENGNIIIFIENSKCTEDLI